MWGRIQGMSEEPCDMNGGKQELRVRVLQSNACCTHSKHARNRRRLTLRYAAKVHQLVYP